MTEDVAGELDRYRDLLDKTNAFVLIFEPDGRVVYANPAWYRAVGYTPEEVEGMSAFDFIHPDSMEKCSANFRLITSGPVKSNRLEAAFRAKDGRKIDVEGDCNCRFVGDTPQVVRGIFRDITERRQLEAENVRQKDEIITAMKKHEAHLLEVSHRLRNPLQILKGHLERIDPAVLSEKDKEALLKIKDSWQRIEKDIKELT